MAHDKKSAKRRKIFRQVARPYKDIFANKKVLKRGKERAKIWEEHDIIIIVRISRSNFSKSKIRNYFIFLSPLVLHVFNLSSIVPDTFSESEVILIEGI